MKTGDKIYLGDSVYAQFDGDFVVLTTENGMGPSNTISLERWVYTELVRFASTPARAPEDTWFKIPEIEKKGT